MKKLSFAVLSFPLLFASCAQMNNEGVGTLTGGVVGGLLGSQFGGGSGKVLAAAGGAIVGSMIGGKIGQTMDRQDKLEMQHALESTPTGKAVVWKNPDSGNKYKVTPTSTYYQPNQQPCREYVTYADIGGKREQIYGKACRKADGSWQIAN